MFPVRATAILLIIAYGTIFLCLRLILVHWWERRWIRLTFWGLIALGSVLLLAWWAGINYGITFLATPGQSLGISLGMLTLALLLATLVSAVLIGTERLIRWLVALFQRNKTAEPAGIEATNDAVNPTPPLADYSTDPVPDPARRLVLGKIAAGVPIVTVSLAGVGMAESFRDIPVREEKLTVPGLPPQLEGLRLWHLSDAHLYHYVRLKNIETLAAAITPLRPDLIAVTGDLADDLDQLAPALEILHSIPTTMGIYATLGNHEYFRGIRRVLSIYDASPVPLLVNDSVELTFHGARFRLAGIDDPQTMVGPIGNFYERTVRRAVPDDRLPTILLSHRPNVFPVAIQRQIMLTLAGHTHGGQIGVGGRSVFEAPGRYLWGFYQQAQSALYTSCGAGHWFPFRLGCPQEAPLFVLTGELTDSISPAQTSQSVSRRRMLTASIGS